MTPAGRLQQLSAHGVAVWWDSISRERLADSGLAALAQDSKVVGVTSNPTIFDQALSAGNAYDEQIGDLAARGVPVEEAARLVTGYDVRWACDVLRPAYDRSGGRSRAAPPVGFHGGEEPGGPTRSTSTTSSRLTRSRRCRRARCAQ
jgi:transaldolase